MYAAFVVGADVDDDVDAEGPVDFDEPLLHDATTTSARGISATRRIRTNGGGLSR